MTTCLRYTRNRLGIVLVRDYSARAVNTDGRQVDAHSIFLASSTQRESESAPQADGSIRPLLVANVASKSKKTKFEAEQEKQQTKFSAIGEAQPFVRCCARALQEIFTCSADDHPVL